MKPATSQAGETTSVKNSRIEMMDNTFKNNNSQKVESRKTLERIDGKYLLKEISNVFNLDKGIFYTIKELLIRPGKTVKEFLFYDRKRIVKPIVFVVFSSLIFIIAQRYFEFNSGTSDIDLASPGVEKVAEWAWNNFGIVNIFLGLYVGLWVKLFFIKSGYNIYEIFVLILFLAGILNLIYTFFGLVEIITGFNTNGLASIATGLYSMWIIGNFFKNKWYWSYLKGFSAYYIGSFTFYVFTILIGVLIDYL